MVAENPKLTDSSTKDWETPKEVLFNKCLASAAVQFPEYVSR